MGPLVNRVKNTGTDGIYRILKKRILTEEYSPGQKLSENTLADEFSCSRTPIRESFKKLEGDGLIIIRPKSGTYVRKETRRDMIELLEVRSYLESLAFRLCLQQISEAEIRRIEKLKTQMDKLIDTQPLDMLRYAMHHFEFHHRLVRASKNALLIHIYERLNFRYSHVFLSRMDSKGAVRTQNEHGKIINLLKRRDPKGVTYMQAHLLGRLKRVYGFEI